MYNTINLNNKTRSTFLEKAPAPAPGIDSSYLKGKRYFQQNIESGNVFNCSPGFVRGHCGGGHHFASFQYCGKEFCEHCGRDGSPIHQRRLKNGIEKTKNWQLMAYLVITVPENVRYLFYDKKILLDFRFKLLRKLKESYNVKRGLARWHWFGDCEACAGSGCLICNDTGASDYWNPHLNILFPGGYVEDLQNYLAPLKNWAKLYFTKLLDLELSTIAQDENEDAEIYTNTLLDRKNELKKIDLVFNYSYVKSDKMKTNRLKYILRATFRRYNEDVKKLLYNLRNIVVWGWKNTDIDTEVKEKQFCPQCLEKGIKHPIKWGMIEKHEKNNYINIIKIENNETKRKSSIYGLHRGIREDDSRGLILLRTKNRVEKIISRL